MYTGLGWGDEHDSRAGGRRGSMKGGLLEMTMMRAEYGDGCEDELTSAVGHDARKTRSSILGAKIEAGQISTEFFPILCYNSDASVCLITGEFRTFCP